MLMALSLHNLTKRYGKTAGVKNVSLTLTTGVYGLLGVNGAGKTTLMRMVCTLTRPTSGRITFDGQDIFTMGEAYRQQLGYLPQDFGFYPDLNVVDYLMYIASLKGLRADFAKRRTFALLEQVGLKDSAKTRMRNLSGGMVRRVGIAQAMLNDPRILILDEPTAGLDPSERIRFRNLISELSGNRLVLLSTHIVSDVEFIANTIILMNQGQFIFTGTSEEIVASLDKRAWVFTVPQSQVGHYLEQFLVANVKTAPHGATELRVLSGYPPTPQARETGVTLEDAFLIYFGTKAKEIQSC